MITSIIIENFKGIRERVRIPIRPVTLLFGPNSGGKSTILQAFHYAREILERRNLDCDVTASGGEFVKLGRFQSFVHNRDCRREVTVGFELLVEREMLPRYESLRGERDSSGTALRSLEWPMRVQVAFSVAWGEREAYVSKYSVDIAGERFAAVTYSPPADPHWGRPVALNFAHPIFQSLGPLIWKLDGDLENEGERNLLAKVKRGERFLHFHFGTRDALPDPADRHGDSIELSYEAGHGDCFQIGYMFLDHLLASLIAGPCAVLADQLRELRYLGPLRDVPALGYALPRIPDADRWSAGLGGWDKLRTASREFVAEVSEWLSSPRRLGTGYYLRTRQLKEIDTESELWDELLRGWNTADERSREERLLKLPTQVRVSLLQEGGAGELRLQDVGVGVSQILPIVVTCVDPEPALTLIEQPELHLHPRMQCELGDLLLRGALGHRDEVDDRLNSPNSGGATAQPRVMLAETHSEHLILRILRRIRETSRGAPRGGIRVVPDDLSVIYVSRQQGRSVPETIGVDEHGEFLRDWPDDFFESDFYERIG